MENGKTTATIAYLTLIGCLIAMTMNLEPKHHFSRFHIRQAFGIHLGFHVIAISMTFLGLSWALGLLYLLYVLILVFCIYNALAYKSKLLPFLGDKFQRWFTFIR